MSRKGRLSVQAKLIWILSFSIVMPALLLGILTNMALAAAFEPGSAIVAPPIGLRQVDPTPTATVQLDSVSVFSVTLSELGYGERALTSPYDTVQYVFVLPENWSVQTGSMLNLELSYTFNEMIATEYPTQFGDLTVKLDGQTLEIFSIDEEFDNKALRVSLPVSLLDDPEKTRHVIELLFDAELLCEVPHKASLVVHPTSDISLSYNERPLLVDLGRYPRPFYQQTFEPDRVRFVLAAQPSQADLSNAVGIAAKLGDLTGNRMTISATTAVDPNRLLANSPAVVDEHLIIIGQPQDNQLLPLLNETINLPVSLHKRQLELVTEGPATVTPGAIFSYTYSITNDTDQTVDLTAVNAISLNLDLIECVPDCIEDGDFRIIWPDSSLAPNETLDLALTLRATDILTNNILENTITLTSTDLGPLNGDTITSAVVSDAAEVETKRIVSEKNDYFFMYNGLAVPSGDGIIQEVASPWADGKAILIITGLGEEAVKKASQAMSSETRFPGMKGQVALVQDVLSPTVAGEASPTKVELTFADLGYPDQVIEGGGSIKQIDYGFEVPYGWQLTDEAALDLYFSHSELIDFTNSGLSVYLNRQPIASASFNSTSSKGGHIKIGLADANVRNINRLTIEIDADMPGVCVDSAQAWVVIKNRSKIFLAHNKDNDIEFDLGIYPHPFHLSSDLTNVLFVLPDMPTHEHLELGLRLAAALGNSAAGQTITPVAIKGGDAWPQDLENYHIIALGRPSSNSMIQEINTQLPQPFVAGSDEIEQQLDNVIFRLAPDVDLGYAQLIPSPWHEDRAILVITGTTDRSVSWVVDVVTLRPWTLTSGNLALVNGEEVKTIDTRKLTRNGAAMTIATAVPELSPIAMATAMITPTASSNQTPTPTEIADISLIQETGGKEARPIWLLPLVGMTALVVIAIFAIAFWQTQRKT